MDKSPDLKKAAKEKKPFIERLREFGQTIGHSCYDMEFYRTVRTRPWTNGLKYLLKLMTIVTVAMAIFLGPALYAGLGQLRDYLDSKIPDGASITLAGGQLSAALPMPINLGKDGENFIVDTSVTGMDVPREQLGDNGVLIGRDAIFFRADASEERTYALKDFPNFSLNKRYSLDWLDQHTGTAAIVLALVLGLFYYLAVTIGNILFVLFGALLAFLFSKLLKVRLNYGQWLACGFFAVTLPLVLGAVFDAFGWNRIPIFPVVFFMILASILADERARGTEKTALPSQKPPKEKPKKDDK